MKVSFFQIDFFAHRLIESFIFISGSPQSKIPQKILQASKKESFPTSLKKAEYLLTISSIFFQVYCKNREVSINNEVSLSVHRYIAGRLRNVSTNHFALVLSLSCFLMNNPSVYTCYQNVNAGIKLKS
jgi:hypothetical protein